MAIKIKKKKGNWGGTPCIVYTMNLTWSDSISFFAWETVGLIYHYLYSNSRVSYWSDDVFESPKKWKGMSRNVNKNMLRIYKLDGRKCMRKFDEDT